MLVLTRKAGERILIGQDIEVVVVRIGPTQVRLGIVAPGQNIARAELSEDALDCGSLGSIDPQHTSRAIREATEQAAKNHTYED